MSRTVRVLGKRFANLGDVLWPQGEETEPASWSRVMAIYAGVAVSLALLLVLRRVDGVTNPQFWAEDGSIFFQENLKLGCWRALHVFFRGFPYLGQRLVACLATPFPIVSAPVVYSTVAYVVAAASLGTFSLPSFRHVIRSDALRAVFCVAVAALPQATELIGNVTNAGWYLGFWLMLVTIMPIPRSPVALGGLSVAYLVATFSTPVSILTAPLWVARALHALRRRRWREASFATLAVGALLALISYAANFGRDSGTPPSLAASLLHSLSMLVFANAALGRSAVLSLVSRLGPSVVYPIALVPLLVLTVLVWLTRLRSLPVLLYCTYGIVASSALALIGHPYLAGMAITLDSLARWSAPVPWPLFSGRYHVLAVSFLYLAFLATIDRLPHGTSRSVATMAVLVWLLCTEAATFRAPPYLDLDWPSNAARLARKLADRTLEPLVIPINPDRFAYAFNISLDARTTASEAQVPAATRLGPLLDTTTSSRASSRAART